jgi:signal transduction histidine kinase
LLQNVTGLNEAILQARSNSLLISLSAMGFLFLALLVIVRRADQLVTARSDELAHAYHDLQTAEMARDDMTDMIVHDLRSPLTAVEISLQMLRKGTFNNELNRTRLLNNAYNSLQRAVSLINDMLGVAKLEEGKLTLSRAPLDVKCLLQERAAFYTVQAESEQKSIEVLAADALPQPQADKEIMTRVLDNLIGKSLKYVKRGGHIRLQALPENNHIQIAVIDDGQGISPRDAERIFDKFAQADNDASRRGTGLGLTFCRLAVEAHGGKIWVESAINQGSTFFFTLPL